MSFPPKIWVRQFLRSPANDIDSVVTPEFKTQNFTDHFGTWLQGGQNANVFTFDELVRQFWCNLAPVSREAILEASPQADSEICKPSPVFPRKHLRLPTDASSITRKARCRGLTTI